jgi:hypothetical protein
MEAAMVPDPPPRSGGRWRGCLLAGCLLLLVLAAVPPLLLWALVRDFESDPGGERRVEREHVLQAAGPAAPGRVEIDVAFSELVVEPGPPGSRLRLEADYDASRFRLEEGLERDGQGWVYRLELRARGLRTFVPAYVDHHGPRLRLQLPPDQAMTLEGEVGMGQSEIELGGLLLEAVDLELGTGEHSLGFSRPLRGALQSLRLDSAMGELTVHGVGNASPRSLAIDHRMGELRLDLAGSWRNDSAVALQVGMGHCSVSLPGVDEAGALVEESRMLLGSRRVEDRSAGEIPPGLPVVRIRTRGGMGEIDIR